MIALLALAVSLGLVLAVAAALYGVCHFGVVLAEMQDEAID